ncbi:MAG: hypothetical protein H6815_05390 [Phycisphaeraceae bacterium]|nr:hypothetical protein [Phycisphaerales bacterium]MCB9859871.1 hypothetical protein [Phycisphaeraceae bacterium]
MIARITGTLEAIDGLAILIATPDGLGRELLMPAFLTDTLTPQLGQTVTLHTMEYLESHNQGASFIPRLIGFTRINEREFFELLTTVKGVGNRKALRAMIHPPQRIAAWILARDAKALTSLPEIGKRTAETMIAELSGKLDAFASADDALSMKTKSGSAVEALPISNLQYPPNIQDAIDALITLGESRQIAEQRVARAIKAVGDDATADTLVAAAFGN